MIVFAKTPGKAPSTHEGPQEVCVLVLLSVAQRTLCRILNLRLTGHSLTCPCTSETGGVMLQSQEPWLVCLQRKDGVETVPSKTLSVPG